MFNKPEDNPPALPDIIFPDEGVLTKEGDGTERSKTIAHFTDDKSPETVKIVEKISQILSPYFIVLVGLFLYGDNFFLGVILIAIGILSLLKISWADINQFIEKIKTLLSSSNDDGVF